MAHNRIEFNLFFYYNLFRKNTGYLKFVERSNKNTIIFMYMSCIRITFQTKWIVNIKHSTFNTNLDYRPIGYSYIIIYREPLQLVTCYYRTVNFFYCNYNSIKWFCKRKVWAVYLFVWFSNSQMHAFERVVKMQEALGIKNKFSNRSHTLMRPMVIPHNFVWKFSKLSDKDIYVEQCFM